MSSLTPLLFINIIIAINKEEEEEVEEEEEEEENVRIIKVPFYENIQRHCLTESKLKN